MLFLVRAICFVCAVWLVALECPAQTQNAVPSGAPPAPAARKANARPDIPARTSAEPFDSASVERMATQCVKFDTEAGAIEMEMLAEAAPETARNFLNLAASGAFDTTTFSRIVKGFVVQGGNLATRQTLTPALVERMRRTIADEPNYVKHVPGVVSMARPQQDNGATTSFFILVSEAIHLDGKFSAFGRVTRGMEVVEAINNAPAVAEKPAKPVRVNRAIIAPCVRP